MIRRILIGGNIREGRSRMRDHYEHRCRGRKAQGGDKSSGVVKPRAHRSHKQPQAWSSSTETGRGGPEPAKEHGWCPLGSGEPLKGFEKGSDLYLENTRGE